MGTPHLRVSVLDYPKLLLKDPRASQLLSDVISQKQINYERTTPNLVVGDKHDMIGTHFLIYDTVDLYRPKLVAAIRNTYEDRALKYGLPLPIDTYLTALSAPAQQAVREFRKRKPILVDCNQWFVDPDYSKANSNLNLSEILFFMVCTYIYRLGFDHFVGATNERYKASRWVAKVGDFPDNLIFMHPTIPFTHKLTLVDHFNSAWLMECERQYAPLLRLGFEILPKEIAVRPLNDVLSEISKHRQLRVAS